MTHFLTFALRTPPPSSFPLLLPLSHSFQNVLHFYCLHTLYTKAAGNGHRNFQIAISFHKTPPCEGSSAPKCLPCERSSPPKCSPREGSLPPKCWRGAKSRYSFTTSKFMPWYEVVLGRTSWSYQPIQLVSVVCTCLQLTVRTRLTVSLHLSRRHELNINPTAT